MQVNPKSDSDGNGGIISCWQDNRAGNYLYGQIYTQRLDSSGMSKWASNGILLSSNQNKAERPKIIADGNGGAFIAWVDHRYQIANGVNNEEADIFAQHIDASGNILWQQGGIAVDSNAKGKAHISLALDGLGGLFLAWDQFNGTYDNQIYAQRVDSSGAVLWANPVAVSYGSSYAYEPQIISDDCNGIILTWYDNRYSNTDFIFAQRLNDNGTKTWSAQDVRVAIGNKDQMFSQIISSGSNGAIITWQDKRASSGINNDNDIYAQALDSNGVLMWLLPGEVAGNAGGIPVCTATQMQLYPKIISDKNGGAFISWIDRRNGVSEEGLYVQHLDNNGGSHFTNNGLFITDRLNGNASSVIYENFSLPDLSFDVDSGLTIAWCASYIDSGYEVLAQRVNAAGNFIWDSLGRVVSTQIGNKLNAQLVASNNGKVICIWQDMRANDSLSTNDDTYASIIPLNAQIDTSTSITGIKKSLETVFPNPVNSVLNIELQGNNGKMAKLLLTNSLGAILKSEIFNGNKIKIPMQTMASGIYFLTIQTEENIYYAKVIKQ
ncbi:MAG TPA: T9SS type A sorting domain-containing protein [Edaphocola sp.]|nr:T9SS type A sorting domain-containing protein [Edaphocola sp.]